MTMVNIYFETLKSTVELSLYDHVSYHSTVMILNSLFPLHYSINFTVQKRDLIQYIFDNIKAKSKSRQACVFTVFAVYCLEVYMYTLEARQ